MSAAIRESDLSIGLQLSLSEACVVADALREFSSLKIYSAETSMRLRTMAAQIHDMVCAARFAGKEGSSNDHATG
jgi:hypothetical protein